MSDARRLTALEEENRKLKLDASTLNSWRAQLPCLQRAPAATPTQISGGLGADRPKLEVPVVPSYVSWMELETRK